ncbi:hypothetical protein AA21291_0672 [Swaminathania salitolerans LMG 21291]|uniref:Uncharacterized protein n=1 Tax=Swaminathania salitolerans TaxID=182838 RepID=A0A511BPN2_9PROT|nr:hypothetical protein AA21291_0672 [Swaminathania salitolerans LMG 21291]GEL02281.1 hypothetical protein SSA02_14440 [Swaminathania salitolerans]
MHQMGLERTLLSLQVAQLSLHILGAALFQTEEITQPGQLLTLIFPDGHRCTHGRPRRLVMLDDDLPFLHETTTALIG